MLKGLGLVGILFLFLLVTLLFVKVYIRITGVYTDLKKEGTVEVAFLFQWIKMGIQLVRDEQEIKLHLCGKIFWYTIEKKLYPKEEKETSPDVKVANQRKDKKKQTRKHKIQAEQTKLKKKKNRENVFHLIKTARELHTMGKRFIQTMFIEAFIFRATYGVENAALTGKSLGWFWSMYGWIYGWIGTNFKMKCSPDISITPYYEGTIFRGEGTATLSFRPIYAIYYGLKIFIFIRKQLKDSSSSSENKKGMEV